MIRSTLSLAAAVALSACLMGPAISASKPAAYVGKWATSPDKCRLPQDTLDAPVLMRARSYDNFETRCDFSGVKKVGPGVWQMRARCTSAGDVSNDRLTVWASARAMTWKWAGVAQKFNFSRCR